MAHNTAVVAAAASGSQPPTANYETTALKHLAAISAVRVDLYGGNCSRPSCAGLPRVLILSWCPVDDELVPEGRCT